LLQVLQVLPELLRLILISLLHLAILNQPQPEHIQLLILLINPLLLQFLLDPKVLLRGLKHFNLVL
jgi:hypothetical protein